MFVTVTFCRDGFGNSECRWVDFCFDCVEDPPQKKGGVRFDNGRPRNLVVVAVLEMRMFGLGNQQATQNCHEFGECYPSTSEAVYMY